MTTKNKIMALLAGGLILSGCGGGSSQPPERIVNGEVVSEAYWQNELCVSRAASRGDFSDAAEAKCDADYPYPEMNR